MATTFNIPLTSLTVGPHNFGPASVADSDTLAVITIDRTVTNHSVQGLNAQPATTTIQVTISQSNDGGTTWNELDDDTMTGGIEIFRGVQQNTTDLGVEFWPGTSRLVRATLVVAGASVAIAGTIATSGLGSP